MLRSKRSKAVGAAFLVLAFAVGSAGGVSQAQDAKAGRNYEKSQPTAGPKFKCPAKTVSRAFSSTHTFLNPEIGTYGVGYRVGFTGIVCTRGTDVVRFKLDPLLPSYEDSQISRIISETSRVQRKTIETRVPGRAAVIDSVHTLDVETGLPQICIPTPIGEACTPNLGDKIRLTWTLNTTVKYWASTSRVEVYHIATLM